MRPRRTTALLLSGACGLIVGCTYGNTHDYAATTPQLDTAGKGRVVVAVHDLRPYVVSGDKTPSFVGLSRTPVGSPMDVRTSSDRTLSDDWTRSVSRALRLRGFEPVAVQIGITDTAATTVQRLRAAGGKAALLFTIRDWKSDTYIQTTLDYDVKLEVIDPAGTVVAQSWVRGHDDLGGETLNPPEYARRTVLDAFQKKMQHMLNDPDVVKALR